MDLSPRPLQALESISGACPRLEEASRAMARLVEQLRSCDSASKMRWLLGAGDRAGTKIEELETHLTQIRSLLWSAQRADDKESSMAAARVRDLIHDIEDMVDVMEDCKLECQPQDEAHSKVTRHNPLSSALKLGKRLLSSSRSSDDAASRSRFLKDMDFVAIEASNLSAQLQKIQVNPDLGARVATALPPEDHTMFGRQKEKDDIVKMLIQPPPSSCDHPTSMITISGIGGIGKTTLAKSIYQDDRVKQRFDLRAWALVSERFDKIQVTKEILLSVNPAYCGSIDISEASFQTLQSQLNQSVACKRLLLVFDDIWSDSFTDIASCQEILSPLKSAAMGSIILVTTRTHKLPATLGTSHTYYLNALSIDDSWSLFKELAFHGSKTSDTTNEFEQIGRKIVAKLNGLPMATKVLGGLLGATKCTKLWMNILDTEFSPDITLSSLQLSYNYLPGQLKQCFAFCSVFPKNYKFDKRPLIQLWIANGFVQPRRASERCLEDLAEDYFKGLLSRSFFNVLKQGSKTQYLMHDLLHDLAQSASANDCFRIEPGMTCHIPSTVRHVSATADRLLELNSLPISPKLRTLLVLRTRSSSVNFLQDGLLEKLRSLRTLDLGDSILTEVPQSICYLSHLRYLSLPSTIQNLPESISKLLQLQTLRFPEKCCLDRLPAGISLLVRLRHLDVDMRHIAEVKSIGRLVSLQGSLEIHIKKGKGHTLDELRNINGLHGQLRITDLDNVLSKDAACKAELINKDNLAALRLEWSSASRIPTTHVDCEVLESLQPHQNLKELHIIRYLGATGPSWLQSASLKELQCLHIINCRSLVVLPPLGLMPSLKQLHMKELSTINRIGNEFYGTDDKAFPSLRVLVFDDFPGLLEWSGEARGNSFPCLRSLKVVDCPKLIQVPSFPPSVSHLTMERTWLISYMRLAPFSSSRSEMLTLDVCTTSVLGRGLFHQRHLESIIGVNIEARNQLVAAEGLSSFTSLQRLQLCYSDITDQNLGSILQVLPSLSLLELVNLPNIISLLVPANSTNLMELQICNCPLLSSLLTLDNLISLKRLMIEKCPKLTAASFPIRFWGLTSLKVLSVSHCMEFQSLPTCGLPSSLEALNLVGCHPKLTEQSCLL